MPEIPAALWRALSLPMRLFWDVHSYTWDDLLLLPEVRETIERRVEALKAAGAHPGDRLIDVGCGTGHYSIAFAKEGFEVTGIDFSAPMLERARAKLEDDIRNRVHLERVDANARLPYADGSFAHALCIFAIQVIADPVASIQEIRRVLRTGGLFLVAVPALARDPKRRQAAVFRGRCFGLSRS